MLDAAIIGAGPYGLSVAAYFQHRSVAFRVFGRPMDTWLAQMPKGMLLKSDGFASNIYDPAGRFTLKRFCAELGIEYADTGVPVRLDTFTSYGLAFQERLALPLESKLVHRVDRTAEGFLLQLEDGENVKARRVVLAVGITHFAYVPEELAHLPAHLLSHSSQHYDLEPFRGREVVVLGAGASALDLAGLLHASGAKVQLVGRRKELKFHTAPTGKARSFWQKIRHPRSGLGPGMRSRFFANAPQAFHYLPERLRLSAVRNTLGPSGGWFSKDMVVGKVPVLLGQSVRSAEERNGSVQIQLRGSDGTDRTIKAQHLIAATGYKVDLARLTFLSEKVRSAIRSVNATPVLSRDFESSVPGLYFAGIAAANSFGPVMRFAFGAGFTAERLTRAITRSSSYERATLPKGRLLADSE